MNRVQVEGNAKAGSRSDRSEAVRKSKVLVVMMAGDELRITRCERNRRLERQAASRWNWR